MDRRSDLKIQDSHRCPACVLQLPAVGQLSFDEPHIATGEEGATVMQLLDAVYDSAGRKTPVRV